MSDTRPTSWWQRLRVAVDLADKFHFLWTAISWILSKSPAAAAVTSVIAVILGALGRVQWPWFFVMGIATFAGAMVALERATAWWERKKRIWPAQPRPSTDQMSEEDRQALATYGDMLDSDKGNLQERILVWRCTADFSQVRPLGGSIIFSFDVVNSSVLRLSVGTTVEGRVKFDATEFHDKPECERPKNLSHSGRDRIDVKQWLLPEEAKVIIDGATQPDGFDVPFDFQNLRISVDSRTPLGALGPSTWLKLTESPKFRIIRHPDGAFAWRRIEGTMTSGATR